MASSNENQPTTFGAIIERKSPTNANITALPSGSPSQRHSTGSSSSPSQPRPIPPALHLATPSGPVQAPLPSPYSMHGDSPHDKAPDLEAGVYGRTSQHNQEKTAVDSVVITHDGLAPVAPPTPSRQISSASTASSSIAGGVGGSEKLVDVRSRECTMWPTQDDMRQKKKKEKRARITCAPMRKLSKRNRVIVSVVIALVVVGLAVGIGVGISRAYHGEVWAGPGKTRPVNGP